MINWDKYAPYITAAECACSCRTCTIDSAENMSEEFLDVLLAIRLEVGTPFKFSSLYRCPNHPAEINKQSKGTHQRGMAADILAFNNVAFAITIASCNHPKIKAIRFAQKGVHESRFVHIDIYDRGFNHIGSY